MISELTKRNIIDELKLRNVNWNGRLDEVEFLNRLFNLEDFPSGDSRYENMRGDIWQHRVNNDDWNYWWVFDDERLNLMGDDDFFLKFIAETIHPVVRSDVEEVESLLRVFNQHLSIDGWKLVEKSRISGRPIFAGVAFKSEVDFRNEEKVSEQYVTEQLKECSDKILRRDFDGAITSGRSLLEGVFKDIYKRVLDEKMVESGDLLQKFKIVKNLICLSEEQSVDAQFKSLCRGLMQSMSALDQLSNLTGDRHVPSIKPEEYHARFYVNSVKTIADFIYDRVHFLYEGRENLYKSLVDELEVGNKRGLTRDELKVDNEIAAILKNCDLYVRTLLKEKFCEEYEIVSFRQNDIFFAALRIFIDNLTAKDMVRVFEKCINNSQTLPPYGGLIYFLSEIENYKPDLLNKKHLEFIAEYKKKSVKLDAMFDPPLE